MSVATWNALGDLVGSDGDGLAYRIGYSKGPHRRCPFLCRVGRPPSACTRVTMEQIENGNEGVNAFFTKDTGDWLTGPR
jgi:hypothetical protein